MPDNEEMMMFHGPGQSPSELPPGEFRPNLTLNDDLYQLDSSFDLDDFQVVRREFFAHLTEPSVTFNNCKFYVNSACLNKFPNVEYVQVLINKEKRIMALRPCHEGDRDAFQWSYATKGKRKPKATTGKLFFAKIVDLMGWEPSYRYKLLGKVVYSKGEYLVVFDLTATEVYQRTSSEGERPKASRTPVFPSEWKDQFGMPLSEHKQSLQIDIFEGYAVFAVSENGQKSIPTRESDGTQLPDQGVERGDLNG